MSVRALAPIRRILLALDAAADSPAALGAAIELAARLDAELLGLFIEDIDLLRLAALPFARELSLTSAARRPLQNTEVERALRARAARAEEALAAAATRLNVRWSFRVTRGRRGVELAGAAVEADLVAFLPGGAAGTRRTELHATVETLLSGASCALLVLPSGTTPRTPFVAVYDGTPLSARALVLAAQLADEDGGEVTVLTVAADAGERAQRRAQAEAILRELGIATHHLPPVPADALALAAALRAARPGTVVMAADSPVLGGDAARRALEPLDCAALLVR